jgi:hypothetical protein
MNVPLSTVARWDPAGRAGLAPVWLAAVLALALTAAAVAEWRGDWPPAADSRLASGGAVERVPYCVLFVAPPLLERILSR